MFISDMTRDQLCAKSERMLGRLLLVHPERVVSPTRPALEQIIVEPPPVVLPPVVLPPVAPPPVAPPPVAPPPEKVIVLPVSPPEFQAEAIPPIHVIQEEVAKFYDVTALDLRSGRLSRNIVIPRMIAVYLARELTLRSTPRIGVVFGGRDHTTILHAIKKIENLMRDDPRVRDEVDILRTRIRQRMLK